MPTAEKLLLRAPGEIYATRWGMSSVPPIGIGFSMPSPAIDVASMARPQGSVTGPSATPSTSSDSVAALVDALNRMMQGAATDPQSGPLMQLLLALFVFLSLMQGGATNGQGGASPPSALELMRDTQTGSLPQTGALAIYVEQTSVTYSQSTWAVETQAQQGGPSLGAQLDYLA